VHSADNLVTISVHCLPARTAATGSEYYMGYFTWFNTHWKSPVFSYFSQFIWQWTWLFAQN